MITPDNQIKILEYNCRLGDPETQPLLLRLQSDFAQLCQDAIIGTLENLVLSFDSRVALGVVLASEGYPGHYDTGMNIPSLKELPHNKDYKVFHAGTKLDKGHIVTNGGRVLCATALGKNYTEAQSNAYALVKKITWPGAFYRTDIGYKALDYDTP